MKHQEFINQLDERQIEEAIANAERKTSGEIRVYISHRERHDALAYARRRFAELGMARTRNRNAVLIYIVPRTQQFAIVGDTGLHKKCADGFWQDIAAAMSQRMKERKFTEAIVHAISEAGAALQMHFPRSPDDADELPNRIVRE